MTFTTKSSTKIYFNLLRFLGSVLLIIMYYDFGTKTDTQQTASMVMTVVVLGFFFGLPHLYTKSQKVIKYIDKKWIVEYPKKRIYYELTEQNVKRIELIENIRARYVSRYNQLNIRFIDGQSIHISSLEIKSFDKLVQQLSKDFKIHRSDFWKG